MWHMHVINSIAPLFSQRLCRAVCMDKQLKPGLCAGAAFLSTAAQSLLRVLLEREPAKRLGSGPQGSEAVMAHPFFRPISWARLLRREARLRTCRACGLGCECVL